MIRRLLTYFAAFSGAFAVCFGFAVLELINPTLAWQFPFFRFFMGMTFPGGAPTSMHYINHIAETWLPFLVAFGIARMLTRGRARFLGAVAIYAAFLLWSLGMVWLVLQGMEITIVFRVGIVGTLIGGAILYLGLVDPNRVG